MPKKRVKTVRAERVEARNPVALRQAQGDRKDFLLEIGCEELPADYMPAALDWGWPQWRGLAAAAELHFSKSNLIWKEMQSFGSPRRLVLRVTGVEPFVHEEVEGPPVSVAFDSNGKPTRAAEAFAQKAGVGLEKLKRKETTRGGVRLVLERSIPVGEVLAALVPQIIQTIAFPKMMRWDKSGARFARPVRSLVCLYGDKVVRCNFGETASGNTSWFGRADLRKGIKVSDPKAYFTVLKKVRVQLEQGQLLRRQPDGVGEPINFKTTKREGLAQQLEAAAKKLGGRLQDPNSDEFEWLLNTVTFLAEDPVVAPGSFRPEYLELPPEVLQTSMAKHLKLFSIRSASSDKLLPNFLAVLEGKPKNAAAVMANYDRIIEARFTDARFFYKEDTKSRLEAKAPVLAKVAFHEKLGSVAERTHHLGALMRSIAGQAGLKVESSDCEKVAHLCKADLVTQMVREFPTLQGTIGGHYARHDGEPAQVAEAIAQQYWPRAAKDPVPTTPLSALVSLADRVDALAGYFGVGLKPTGSADPYGLRRQALGLVRILIEPPKGISFVGLSFDRLFDESIQSWGARLTLDPKNLKKELRAFLRERFEWVSAREAPADRELVSAVLAAGDDDLAGAWERLQLLRRLWASGDGKRKTLEAAAKVAERTGRIVKSVKDLQLPDAVDPAILKEPEEKELWETWNRIAPRVKEQLEQRQYEEATKSYSALYPAVHSYFEKVFVMAEDEGLRKNRLALLKQIHGSLALSFADLGRLPLPGTVEN